MNPFLQSVFRFRQMYQKCFRSLGEELHLTQLEIDILLFLKNNPERNTARDIVIYRGFAKSNVSKSVEHLEATGWLQVTQDPASRRMKRLTFCPERSKELNRLSLCQSQCLSRVFAGFSPEELQQFTALLGRADANIQSALNELQ